MTVTEIRAYMMKMQRLTLGELVMHLSPATVAEIFKAMCWLKLDEKVRKHVISGYISPINAYTVSRLSKDKQVKLLREAIYMLPEAFQEEVSEI